MVLLLLWCSLACVAAISNGAANTITVLSDGNKTNCSTNSSGTFCYSLSYAMKNHLITDNTTVLLASPKIDVLDRINVSNVSNLVIRGLGIDSTICYYRCDIGFYNISGLEIINLTIRLCETTPHLSQVSHNSQLDLYLFKCSNVTIDHMKISHLTGGLAISSPRGDIRVLNSVFEHSNSTTGGVYVNIARGEPNQHIINKTQYNITFENCVFHKISNSYNNGKSTTRKSSGHGGGLLLILDYAKNVHIAIFNCHFTSNQAPWGGGLFVGFRTLFTSNTLVIKDTVFANNIASLGGGGMDIGFYEMKYHNDDNILNAVTIENVTFQNNSAGYGGGNTIFSDLGYQISHKHLNNVTFKNCTWKDNLANFSTAVDVSPNIFDNIAGGFPVSTAFYDCRFINNKVLSNSRHKNTTKLFYRSGTVMITALPIKFGGETIFADNVGTALHVVATRVTFDSWSNVIFKNNSGSEGGALALVGMATLLFNSNSTFLFANNSADFVGGAIYWYSVDQHDYFSSHTCFLKKDNYNKTDNVSFTFINNTAHSGIGHTIFATTLIPCKLSCGYFSHNNSNNLLEVFNCVANFSGLVLKKHNHICLQI